MEPREETKDLAKQAKNEKQTVKKQSKDQASSKKDFFINASKIVGDNYAILAKESVST